ncbi:MAG: hypothetical protein HY226_02980 [Candidatus Vogelbacteria bacterium]|nr:hypothetical protein [Candidatus Vogelbacteria bacterium]
MKAGNVRLAIKLRTLLTDMILRDRLTSDELTIIFNEAILGDNSPHGDTLINDAKALMLSYLSRKIMSSDEMQTVVDQAVNLSKAGVGLNEDASVSLSGLTTMEKMGYIGFTIN